MACGDVVFPRHIESVVPDSRHLKRLVFSLTFRLPDGLWKPSLLMSIYNVLLTSVRVKDKACIYNDLRLAARVGSLAVITAGVRKGKPPILLIS